MFNDFGIFVVLNSRIGLSSEFFSFHFVPQGFYLFGSSNCLSSDRQIVFQRFPRNHSIWSFSEVQPAFCVDSFVRYFSCTRNHVFCYNCYCFSGVHEKLVSVLFISIFTFYNSHYLTCHHQLRYIPLHCLGFFIIEPTRWSRCSSLFLSLDSLPCVVASTFETALSCSEFYFVLEFCTCVQNGL